MTDSRDLTSGTKIDAAALIGASELPAPTRITMLMEVSRQALEHATSDVERLRQRTHWQSLSQVARAIGRTDIMVQAAEMVFTAEHYIYLADKKAPAEKGGRGKKVIRAIDARLLKEIRKAFRHVDTRLFHDLVKMARENSDPLTRKAIRTAGRDSRHSPPPGAAPSKVAYYTGQAEYITPRYIIGAARRAMGGIDLDPATHEKAQEFVEAARWFTVHENGLTRRWEGRVWLNPPYSRGLLEAFVGRLVEHLESGHVTQACLLVNNGTDTAWFHSALDRARAFCLLAGRVRFHLPDGRPTGGAPIQGQVVLYFAAKPDRIARFVDEFTPYGRVCHPVLPQEAA